MAKTYFNIYTRNGEEFCEMFGALNEADAIDHIIDEMGDAPDYELVTNRNGKRETWNYEYTLIVDGDSVEKKHLHIEAREVADYRRAS